MAVLVIGGSGLIGSRVVRALTANGVETTSCDLIQSDLAGEGADWVCADITNSSSAEKLFIEYEFDTVIHLVGIPVIAHCERNPTFSFLSNVISVQNTLEAMRTADVRRIIFASSAAVYGYYKNTPVREIDPVAPTTMYGFHKLIAEQLIRCYCSSYGIEYVVFRLFNVYGANPHTGKDVLSIFLRRALAHESLILEGPNKFRDFVCVGDVGTAFLDATRCRITNQVINIGSGTKTTLRETAEILRKYFPNLKIDEKPTSDDGTGLQADITLARDVLNFKPIDPMKGIEAFFSEFAKCPKQ
jgi:UDP-glucose 4-epimerase